MADLYYEFTGVDIGLPLINCGGFHNYLHTKNLPLHKHKGVEITYVIKGDTCWLLEDNTELFLSGGSLAVMQPNVSHRGQDNVISPCWLLWFILDFDSPDCLRNTPFAVEDAGSLRSVFTDAGNCVLKVPEPFGFYTERLLERLPQLESPDFLERASLRTVLCQIVIAAAEILSNASGNRSFEGMIVRSAEKLVTDHLDRGISVAEVAEKLGLSPTGFCKQFMQQTGVTPADYFRRIKIRESRRRLADSDESITEIAFELGFSSSQHFASVFKKYTGLTPREFRRNTQKKQ